MIHPLICEKSFRIDKRGKIYCTESGTVCAHQYWCDMAVQYKQFPEAADCPGRSYDGENRKTDAV